MLPFLSPLGMGPSPGTGSTKEAFRDLLISPWGAGTINSGKE